MSNDSGVFILACVRACVYPPVYTLLSMYTVSVLNFHICVCVRVFACACTWHQHTPWVI